MLFLGMANAYIMRTNMSIAIVAMVNHTALPRDENIPVDFNECSNAGSTTNVSNHVSKKGSVRKRRFSCAGVLQIYL